MNRFAYPCRSCFGEKRLTFSFRGRSGLESAREETAAGGPEIATEARSREAAGQKREPAGLRAPATPGRWAWTRRFRLLISLSWALCFPAASQAAELDPAAPGPRLPADPHIAALEQALTNAARRMAEAPKVAPPSQARRTGLTLSIALLLAAAFGLARVAVGATRRWNQWLAAPARELDLAATVLMEDPLMLEFFRALQGSQWLPRLPLFPERPAHKARFGVRRWQPRLPRRPIRFRSALP